MWEQLVMAADERQIKQVIQVARAMPPDPRLPGPARADLALAFLRRYELTRDSRLLETAIEMLRAYLDGGLAPEDTASTQTNLAGAWLQQYQRTGRAAALDEAVAAARAAAQAPASGDERAGRLSNLAWILNKRASHFNSAADVNQAVLLLEEAVASPGVSNAKQAEVLSNLAGALRDKFRQDHDVDVLRKAVAAQHESVRLAPPGSLLARQNRANLAGGLRDLASSTEDLALLDESNAILHDELASSPQRGALLHSLGRGYLARHRLSGDSGDALRAQAALREALELTKPDEQVSADIAMLLATAHDDPAQVLPLLETVLRHQTAAAITRFEAAVHAAVLLAAAGRAGEAVPYWVEAVALLPVVAWRGSSYQDRRSAVDQATGLATAAAACGVAAGEAAQAVELLETGRGVLWGHLLDIRADLVRLRAAHADLARRLEVVAVHLSETHHV